MEGYIEDIIFQNKETGFIIAKLKKDSDIITITGVMPFIKTGEQISCQGEWLKHPKYGKQFKVDSFHIKAPQDVIGIQKYLESGLVKGIGPTYAKKIVKKFGKTTLDIIDKNPEKLLQVDGIGKKRMNTIKLYWNDQKGIREVMVFLRSYDIPISIAQKIYKKYQNSSIAKVKENPYRLAQELFGVGFKIVDKLANNMGISKNSEIRILSGIDYTFYELANLGHTCFPKNLFLLEAKKKLNVETDLIEKILDKMIQEKKIIQNKNIIWPLLYYNLEKNISEELFRIKNNKSFLRKINYQKAIEWIEKKQNIKLAKEQKEAIITSFEEKIHIITGGPGTGKSTITKSILQISMQLTNKILLAAPTGRAAKRMTEITNKKAFTIHSLLEFDFIKNTFKKNKQNPLKADIIIIDESSMIDTHLMYHLLFAISDNTKIIFVGDIDQLPSVGPGHILKDLILSEKIKFTKLVNIFRQSKGSNIIINAHKINKGIFPNVSNQKYSDFRFIEENDPEKIQDIIIKLLYEKSKIYNQKSIQVLSPMKKGIIGIENLNEKLQKKLNPSKEGLIKGFKKFCIGDKVMQIRNNYDKNIFNGDIGKIININIKETEIMVSFGKKIVQYDSLNLDELVLAYAVSVHKYQGSECEVVIMPIHTSHFMLLFRNLLYTAVTRSKKLFYLIGSKKAIYMAINNKDVLKRYTGLRCFIKNNFK